MKKLIIAVAIVCAAAMSQASTILWSSSAMKLADGSATSAKGQISGYLFMIEKGDYDTLKESATSGKALSEAVWAAYGADLGSADAYKDGTKGGKADLQVIDSSTTEAKDYAAGTYYAAIIYTDNVTDGNYHMGNISEITVNGSFEGERQEMGVKIYGDLGTSPGATAWVGAVPEPTSGLLLLLGVAGLALRRRRA